MTIATSMLGAGMDTALSLFPSAFTTHRVAGAFSGLFAPTSVSEEQQVDGRRGKSTATLTFPKTSTYVPTNGDRLTVGGVVWVVSLVGGGAVVWELGLISEDE